LRRRLTAELFSMHGRYELALTIGGGITTWIRP
jgi:hypothetical protein